MATTVTAPERVASEVFVQRRLVEQHANFCIYSYALVWEGTEIITHEVFIPAGGDPDVIGVSDLFAKLSR